MSAKKEIRARFRAAVFKAADYRCQGPGCSFRSTPELAEKQLDAHHITDRSLMPRGGYVPKNGIALCPECHEFAEEFHSTGEALSGWHPHDLYLVIGSSEEEARAESIRLLR